ncbi:protein Jade-1 [Clonorchis sinensis]|uniref:Protein Jade-1 n=1 Tax=Clonorchis sinensis TaxID=79923 RepID=G7YX70_CLOSI|nr:protein Jade-1 [Clonorchis sinensis]
MDVDAAKRWLLDRHLPLNDANCVHMSFRGDSATTFVVPGENAIKHITRIYAENDLSIGLSSSTSFSLYHKKPAQKSFTVPRMVQRTSPRITHIGFERDSLTMPRIKEVTHLLNDWTPTFLNEKDGKPAELFDAHPLSEMMVSPEAEVGKSDSLILIENNWRSEWHRNGVQVPVLPLSAMRRSGCRRIAVNGNPRKLPYKTNPSKLWHDMNDQRFDDSLHCILDVRKRTPSSYQIDNLDYAWISIVNEERDCLDLPVITDAMLEDIMEALEQLTFLKMHQKLKELEAQTLEFDENARCDICLSYEGEDGNELVFCDGCFLCVHQACYGIPRLPEGSWICRQCEAGVKSTTTCSLCPNTGGAMKMTEDGTRWCHISCALWVPEVGFGDVELMEPVVRLENIPQARRNLLCSICRSRYGAPIQCSNKKCKVAFHVTCAFQSNLIMRQELVDRDVRLVDTGTNTDAEVVIIKDSIISVDTDVSLPYNHKPVKTSNKNAHIELFGGNQPQVRYGLSWVMWLSKVKLTLIIIIDSMTSVFNTDASLSYNSDLSESHFVKKIIKVDGSTAGHLCFRHSELGTGNSTLFDKPWFIIRRHAFGGYRVAIRFRPFRKLVLHKNNVCKYSFSHHRVTNLLTPSKTSNTCEASAVENLKMPHIICPQRPRLASIQQRSSYCSLVHATLKVQWYAFLTPQVTEISKHDSSL